ncbi:hypothetical protein AB5I41_16395 [Sphingomonas sp. MMS24-JH45]
MKMMEALGSHLEELDKGFLGELVDAFPAIAEGYSGEAPGGGAQYRQWFLLKRRLQLRSRQTGQVEALRDARD